VSISAVHSSFIRTKCPHFESYSWTTGPQKWFFVLLFSLFTVYAPLSVFLLTSVHFSLNICKLIEQMACKCDSQQIDWFSFVLKHIFYEKQTISSSKVWSFHFVLKRLWKQKPRICDICECWQLKPSPSTQQPYSFVVAEEVLQGGDVEGGIVIWSAWWFIGEIRIKDKLDILGWKVINIESVRVQMYNLT